jgi:hypothetical protein
MHGRASVTGSRQALRQVIDRFDWNLKVKGLDLIIPNHTHPPISPLKKSPLAWFHSTAIHMAAKAVLPS